MTWRKKVGRKHKLVATRLARVSPSGISPIIGAEISISSIRVAKGGAGHPETVL